MWSDDIDALLDKARAGEEAARTELTLAVQKDLQVFIAAYALDQAMVDAVFAASWADGRRMLMEAIQPAADPQAGLWMGRVAGEAGGALAKRIRDGAVVRLRQGLTSSDQQAIAAQDTLLHLIAQAGLEAMPEDSALAPAVPQLIRDRLRNMPPTAHGLLTKRYTEGLTLAQLCDAQGRNPAELASALSMARSAVDWQSGGAMLFDPGDSEFPLLIEEFIAGIIPYDVRLRLAESLLRDIGRTAGFIRQVRLDLVLTAFAQEPRAPEQQPLVESPKARTSTRLPMPASGILSVHELHRAASGAGRTAKGGPGGSSARVVLIAGGALLVLAVIAGGIGLSSKAPATRPTHATASSVATPPASASAPATGTGTGTASATGTATTAASPAAARVAEPAGAVSRTPAPPASGPAVARIESGQAIVSRAGGRYSLQAGAQLPAGEALESDAGPLVLGLSAGRSLTIGVNSQLRGLQLSDGQVEVAQLERGQAHVDGPEGAHAVAVGVGHALAVGNGAAFTVTTTADGMRLEVARGTVSIQRSGLPAVAVGDHRIALVHDRGEVALESGGALVALIKLGGPGVVVDGRRWTSQLQAQHDGLRLMRGAAVPAGALNGVEPALRPLLDPALAGDPSVAGAVILGLALPDGLYDLVGWVVGPPGSPAGQLGSENSTADTQPQQIGAHGWQRLPPIRAHALQGQCIVSYACRPQQLLAGLEIFAIGTPTGGLRPTVFLDAPAADQSISAPATLVLAADAYAPLSAIRTVEFLIDGVRLGAATTAPYTLPWTIQAAGPHVLTAHAVSDNGLSATSLPVTVTVTTRHQAALLLSSTEGGGPPAGGSALVLSATPVRLEGAVAKVEFLCDGVRIGEVVAPPFRLPWGKAAAGEHLITAIAQLATGGSLTAEPLKIVVQPPARAPVVAVIESPEDGSEVPENSHLNIRVRATSRDGRVTRVDYFADEQKVGESTAAPFTYVWTKATPGLHHLRVVASDDHGASAGSEPVMVLIGKNVTFVLARGIHLGGEAVDIDGCHWLAQEEAVRGGLTVKGAKAAGELAAPAPTADPGLAALLGAGLLPEGEEITLSQVLPNGVYQVSLWLSEAKAGAGPPIELELQGIKQSLSGGRMGKAAWARFGPFTAKVANQALTLVLHPGRGAAALRLHGLAIAVPLPGSAPRPLVELLFHAVNGALTPNTGLTAGIAPTATIAADGPQHILIAAPGGGSGSMDFGKAFRPAAIDVPGLAPALRGLKSFTISAWLNNRVAQENGGGDRIVCWLHDGNDGAELVYHDDGSLQLAVNSQVDGPGSARRSSPGLISSNDSVPLDNWRFVAVAFDTTQAAKQVRYYVGSGTERATLDSAVDLNHGPVGMNPAPELTIGHTYLSNRKAGADRMYRGIIAQVRLWGSASDSSGALTPEQIIAVQAAANPTALRAPFERGDLAVGQGLVAWLNAAAGVTTLGGRVSRWDDLTGRHHDLVQDASSQRPLLVDTPNSGGPSIACDNDQHLEISGAAGLDPETFTLMAWVRQERFAAEGEQRRWIVGKNGNELDAGHFSLFTANGTARAYLNLGGDIRLLELSSPAGAMHEHAWHLLAMTYDGARMALYLDGTRVGEAQAKTKRSPGTGAFVVGRRPDNFGSFDGSVAEVRLYDRALDETELKLIESTTRASYFLSSLPATSTGAGSGAVGATGAAGAATGGTLREVMLWDGEGAAGGTGWSAPAGTTIAMQDAVAYHGTHALQFHAGSANFANCGWNWRGWGASSPIDDATAHANLIVALKVDGTAKPSSIRLVLRSPRPDDHHKSGDSDPLNLLPYCPTLLDGAWHEVVVPIKDITAKDAGFDLHHLFELCILLNAPGTMASDVYIDDLGYGGKP